MNADSFGVDNQISERYRDSNKTSSHSFIDVKRDNRPNSYYDEIPSEIVADQESYDNHLAHDENEQFSSRNCREQKIDISDSE